MSNQRVLVTGGTGFLGRHLVADLCKKSYDVTMLVRSTSQLDPFKGLPVEFIYGDINQTKVLLEATYNKDIVYHLAGLIAYKKSDRPKMEKVNVAGTRNVIDACITNNVSKVLYLSSVVAIGASFKAMPIDEDFEFNLSKFNLGYFETKRKAEKIVMDAVEEHGLNVYIVNPSTIYGAGDATKGSRKTQLKVAKGKFPFYPPGGVNIVYVGDVLKMIHLVLEKGQVGRRYIVAGDNMTIRELFESIASEAGVEPPKIPLPRIFMKFMGALGDVMTYLGRETSLSSETAVTTILYHWFSSQRAQSELGFRPSSSQKAISESIEWVKKQGYLN